VTTGRALWRRGGLAIALPLAQIQPNPDAPRRSDDRPPEPLTTDDGHRERK
jgi:hypothetical protein